MTQRYLVMGGVVGGGGDAGAGVVLMEVGKCYVFSVIFTFILLVFWFGGVVLGGCG
jgi:hypothetical protein